MEFQGKQFTDLEKIEQGIEDKIRRAGRGTDVSFWENILDHLRPQMARQRLREQHQKLMKLRVEKIRAEQLKQTKKLEAEMGFQLPAPSTSTASTSGSAPTAQTDAKMEVDEQKPDKKQLDAPPKTGTKIENLNVSFRVIFELGEENISLHSTILPALFYTTFSNVSV